MVLLASGSIFVRVLQAITFCTLVVRVLVWGSTGVDSLLGHENSELPCLTLTLTPLSDIAVTEQPITAINVTIKLRDHRAGPEAALLALPLNKGPTPSARYDGDAITATDSCGPLALTISDSNEADAWREWFPTRKPCGEVMVVLVARPRWINATTPMGPRIDLRADQGGLVGYGMGFLPLPPGNEDWLVVVEWDLQWTTPATKAVWTAQTQTDPRSHVVGVPQEVVGGALFVVGPVQRYPAWDEDERRFSMYWFGKPPFDMTLLPQRSEQLFLGIAGVFGDETASFSVVIRQVENGNGGESGFQDFILEYSLRGAGEFSLRTLLDLLSHETVHSYPAMWPERAIDGWYTEGIANYYAPVAPYLRGAVSKSYLLETLNQHAHAYYTSPAVDLGMDAVMEHLWEDEHIHQMMYNRGLMYFTRVHGLIAQASEGQQTLEDITIPLFKMKLNHTQCQTPQFLELLGNIIGDGAAQESLDAMWRGKLIIPPTNGFANFGVKLVRHDRERFELGFELASLKTQRIEGVVEGSRAQLAGVRDGDKVVYASQVWMLSEEFDGMMNLTLQRYGEEISVSYWPRSWKKVESYMWVDAEGDGEVQEL
jgi:hypothetical protein